MSESLITFEAESCSETLAPVFSCKLLENYRGTFLTDQLRKTVSENECSKSERSTVYQADYMIKIFENYQ